MSSEFQQTNFSHQTWLITGASGFIGSHLMDSLLQSIGIKLIAVDNFDPFYSRLTKESNMASWRNSPQVTFLELDLREPESYQQLEKYQLDGIVHLAAKAGVRPSIEDPIAYQKSNVEATQYLLELARKLHVRQFVFASSSSVYGVNPAIPWQENEPLMPISPYASTKLSCEMLGHVYSHLFGIRFIGLRFFTVYGPRQRPDLAVHKFVDQILHEQPIAMFGDGSTSRDYTFVDDIIQGIRAAMVYDQSEYELINLGNHDVIELHKLIAQIEKTLGKKAIINQQPLQAGDVPVTYADISKAKALLGFVPQTSIEQGLAVFYEWYKEQHQID